MQISDLADRIPFLPRKKTTGQRFWELARPHVKLLYNIALRYTGNKFDAEDLVQETIYAAFKKRHQLREESKCKSWLFVILRNTYLKTRRQNDRITLAANDDAFDYLSSLAGATDQVDPEQALARKVESEQIQSVLDELPEKYKSPLLLYYMEGMSYQQISDTMDIPMGTVMSRLARAKDIVKKKVLRHHLKESLQDNVVELRKRRG
jgi:RNA polymerase sigma-70 factor (ECF subfamily)